MNSSKFGFGVLSKVCDEEARVPEKSRDMFYMLDGGSTAHITPYRCIFERSSNT